MSHGANNGLPLAMNLLKPVMKKHEGRLGWADLIQVGQVAAITTAIAALPCVVDVFTAECRACTPVLAPLCRQILLECI
jgi:hypothetical protein